MNDAFKKAIAAAAAAAPKPAAPQPAAAAPKPTRTGAKGPPRAMPAGVPEPNPAFMKKMAPTAADIAAVQGRPQAGSRARTGQPTLQARGQGGMGTIQPRSTSRGQISAVTPKHRTGQATIQPAKKGGMGTITPRMSGSRGSAQGPALSLRPVARTTERTQAGGDPFGGTARPTPVAPPSPTPSAFDGPTITRRMGASQVDLTVVLVIGDRPQILGLQVQTVTAQTAKLRQLVVVGKAPLQNVQGATVVTKSHKPTVYDAIWEGLQRGTAFIAVLEGDAMPARRYFQQALDYLAQAPALVALAGEQLTSEGELAFIADPDNPPQEAVFVDQGRGGWIAPSAMFAQILGQTIAEYPNSPVVGLHLSAIAQKLGIPTVVLPYAADTRASTAKLVDPVSPASAMEAYRGIGWLPLCELGQEGDEEAFDEGEGEQEIEGSSEDTESLEGDSEETDAGEDDTQPVEDEKTDAAAS